MAPIKPNGLTIVMFNRPSVKSACGCNVGVVSKLVNIGAVDDKGFCYLFAFIFKSTFVGV